LASWDRSTLWRQGSLLTAEAADAFALRAKVDSARTAVMVISHDCDLAQSPETEPSIELVVGRFIGESDGNFTYCKNLRQLHLPCSGGTSVCNVELDARQRITIPKSTSDALGLDNFSPDSAYTLSATEKKTLQRWLALRYSRAAFPDEFNRRLGNETGVAERLGRAFKITGRYIPGIFFDVDEGMENERHGPNDVYRLIITVLYTTDQDSEAALKAAEQARAQITEVFQSRCGTKTSAGMTWRWIELVGVEVMSDQALSYAQSQYLMRWQADHLSLRTDPEQPLAPT
jgi:hypothetical protein